MGVSGIRVKIKSIPKKFTTSRYTLLHLNSEIYIVHVIDCE